MSKKGVKDIEIIDTNSNMENEEVKKTICRLRGEIENLRKEIDELKELLENKVKELEIESCESTKEEETTVKRNLGGRPRKTEEEKLQRRREYEKEYQRQRYLNDENYRNMKKNNSYKNKMKNKAQSL